MPQHEITPHAGQVSGPAIKVILVLLDGLGDRSYAELGNQTPLAAAATPNLDRLSALGANGLFHASFPGECLPSETAHYLMFGYDRSRFPGRGLLEAAGEGVALEEGDVAVLAHLAGVDFDKKGIARLVHGRDDIPGGKKNLYSFYRRIARYDCAGLRFELHHIGRNDGILRIRGGASPDISDSDPILRGAAVARVMPVSGSLEPAKAKKTAGALNDYLSWCHVQLAQLQKKRGAKTAQKPPTFLVTQRAGRRIAQVPFGEKWGFHPALMASGGVYKGLAAELGFDFIPVKDSTRPGRDLAGRVDTALTDASHDFIHVHTKVPDEQSHKGDPGTKKQAVEKLDTGLDGLVRALGRRDDLLVVVTSDHSTPSRSNTMVHSGEPVPLLMAGGAIRRDRMDRFDEISAADGGLGYLQGAQLMYMILNAADRAILSGLRLGNKPRPYMPVNYPAFQLLPPGKTR